MEGDKAFQPAKTGLLYKYQSSVLLVNFNNVNNNHYRFIAFQDNFHFQLSLETATS